MLEDLLDVVKLRFNVNPASDAEKDSEKDEKKENPVEIPKDLAFKCPRCLNMIMTDELVKNLKVCPECGYHSRISSEERLNLTIDKGSFIEFDKDMVSKNPIDFPGYDVKQSELREKTGLKDAVITGECKIRGIRCVIGIMDSR
ncbi:MAG: acetyl-CoA carboxylase carboxyl transferase subunit beta, partial [Oscillospiraceae bacterium]